MKKKLSALTVPLIVTILVICMAGLNCELKVFGAETGNVPQSDDSKIDYKQLEMPIVAINTNANSEISSDKSYTNAQISIINSDGNYDMTDMGVSIRLRGNSTRYPAKKSYKMKFEKKQNPLNIGDDKGKPWALLANAYDETLLRNLTIFRFANQLTNISYAPNCRSVELYLNGQYQGVYLLCEDINVSNNRVAIEEKPDEVEKNGYLVTMSKYGEENKFEIDTAEYEIKSDLSQNESIKEQQITYISNYISEAYNALRNGKKNEVEKYIDIDSLVDVYIGSEIVKTYDVGWDSFNMYKDADGKLCFGPLWDFDIGMGNSSGCVKRSFDSWAGISEYHVMNNYAFSCPWFCHALSNKWFREMVEKRWNKLQGEINKIPNSVITEAEANYKSYCRNYEKWGFSGKKQYIGPEEIRALKTFKEQYTFLSNWLKNRTVWLAKYYNSKDFKKGIFIDEEGKKISEKSNILELASVMAIPYSPEVKMSSEVLPNTGISVSVKNGGSEVWHALSVAAGFMLEKDQEYVLSYDYKCSEDRPLPFYVQHYNDPLTLHYKDYAMASNKLQHYEATFKALENDTNCCLVFFLGGGTFNGTVVNIENMRLVKKSSQPTPTDTPELLSNTSFKDGTKGWNLWTEGNAKAVGVSDAVYYDSSPASYRIDCSSKGSSFNYIQLFTTGLKIDNGKKYRLTFRAKCEKGSATPIIVLMTSKAPWKAYSGFKTVKIQGDWATYQVDLTSNKTDPNGRLTFYLGGNIDDGSKLYIDTLSLKKIK